MSFSVTIHDKQALSVHTLLTFNENKISQMYALVSNQFYIKAPHAVFTGALL